MGLFFAYGIHHFCRRDNNLEKQQEIRIARNYF